MREFILLSLKGKTNPDFSLNNLPEQGRMDLVCRTISNTLFISKDMRRDTIIHISLNDPNNPPILISFIGNNLKGLEPDEQSVAKYIKLALKKSTNLKLNKKVEILPGLIISKKSFEKLIKEKLNNNYQLIYLHKKGQDIRKTEFPNNTLFILGDYIGLPKNTEKPLKILKAIKIKLSPKMLFACHCPIIVHNELDRR